MIKSFFAAASVIVMTASIASAQSLLVNFHSTNAGDDGPVAAPYLTLDPAHSAGFVPSSDTTWNNFNTAASSSALSYANGSAATGVSITFGNATAGGTTIDYTTTAGIRTDVALGTGGNVPGRQSLLAADSIYGPANSSAMARQGWLGQDNVAIGMRIDGLSAGSYTIYVLSRNTNSNAALSPQLIYATTGALSASFDFSSINSALQANIGYASSGYAGEYTTFEEDNNYVAFNFTVSTGESLFIAARDTASNTRGFLNGVQIVAVPEPGAGSLMVTSALALLLLFRCRRAA